MTKPDLLDLTKELVDTYEEFDESKETPNENRVELLYPRGVGVEDSTAEAIVKMEIDNTDLVIYKIEAIEGGLSLEIA